MLVCLLMLLPLQWSVAATGWYGPHPETEAQQGAWQLGEMWIAASDAGAETTPTGVADSKHACSSDCHVDDPLVLGVPLSGVPPQHAAPHFEYFAPTSSHIPSGPERPDRLRAA